MAVPCTVEIPDGMLGYKPGWHIALADSFTLHAVKPVQPDWTKEELHN